MKSSSSSKTLSFIEGYDNAIVQTNIHVPAEAHPVRTGRASNVAIIEGVGASASASQASFKLGAIPDSSKLSNQTERLFQRAKSGKEADVRTLADWANINEAENEQLRSRLRKQQHDFASLFEMVSATSARAMDVVSLQSYMLRTVSGHFAAPKVMIIRRMQPGDRDFYCTASQGLNNVQFKVAMDSTLCRRAFEGGASFSLREFIAGNDTAFDAPEIDALRLKGMDIVVPLLQEVDQAGAVLEGFLLIGPKLTGKPFSKNDIEFLDVLSKMFAICLRNENLYRRSIVDTLTGVSTRGHFDAQLSQELERIKAIEGQNVCLMMLDVDHFKRFNDTYGHQTGDLVLKALAKTLVQQVRNVDLVARYGGEEFAIICVEINKDLVMEVAERLMNAIRDMEVHAPDGTPLHITASFGIACFPHDANDMNTLIQLADKALYKSKDAGRNRITMADASFNALPTPPNSKVRPVLPSAPQAPAPLIPESMPSDLDIIQSKQTQASQNRKISGEYDRRKLGF